MTFSAKKFYQQFGVPFIASVMLFVFALCVRLHYQSESEIATDLTGDARKYFICAFNLANFSAYSLDLSPDNKTAPTTRTDLSPGYPIFLTPFIRTSASNNAFFTRVKTAQAIIGSLTVVLTFLLASQCLPRPWAVFAAVLTALSPHLIAYEFYVLTETLFTFLTLAGVYVLSLSWKNNWYPLSILAAILLGYSAETRALNILIVPFLAAILFFDHRTLAFQKKSIWLRHVVALAIGYVLISGAGHYFVKNFATEQPPVATGSNPKTSDRESPAGDDLQSPQKEDRGTYVSASNTWKFMLAGSYPGFMTKDWEKTRKGHFHAWRDDSKFDRMLSDRSYGLRTLKERVLNDPASYLKWYLGGKMFFRWRWDNVYLLGDVYIYALKKRGFESDLLLRTIHQTMKHLHWPLFAFTLLAPILLLTRMYRRSICGKWHLVALPAMVFFYNVGVLTVLMPHPRYALPARPYAYLMAVAALFWLYTSIKNRFNNSASTEVTPVSIEVPAAPDGATSKTVRPANRRRRKRARK